VTAHQFIALQFDPFQATSNKKNPRLGGFFLFGHQLANDKPFKYLKPKGSGSDD